MRLLEHAVRLFAPHICIGCGAEEDALLCDSCTQTLSLVPSRCYRCSAVTRDYEVCKPCSARTALRQVAVYTHYTGLGKELVHRLKYERAQAGIDEAAELMHDCLQHFPPDAVLVYIPTASSRVRLRGYDHARLLARCLAARTALPSAPVLRRLGQAHQVGSNRTERLRQLQHAFRVVHPEQIRGKHVVLVDDVLTTGATLETAARTLKRAGAARVSGVVFAQA